jgi:hypothetical protein
MTEAVYKLINELKYGKKMQVFEKLQNLSAYEDGLQDTANELIKALVKVSRDTFSSP